MMGVPQLFAWLMATAALTLVAIMLGARLGNAPLTIAAAVMFAAVAIIAGWRLNRLLTGLATEHDAVETLPMAAQRNARLMALCYGWGGLTMLAAYLLSPLHWQHAWQYGAGMLLIAVAIAAYGTALAKPQNPTRRPYWLIAVQRLTLVQGIAAAIGLVFLVVSGKLTAGKTDWVANVIFVAGGASIAVLSAIAVHTQRRLMHQAR